MLKYLLLVGILTGDGIALMPQAPLVIFNSKRECVDVATNPTVVGSYGDLFPDYEVVIWCEEVRR